MQYTEIRASLEQEIGSRQTSTQILNAHSHHPALKPFTTAADIISFLKRDESEQMSERSAVIGALIDEAQTTKHSCWNAILLVAYFPALCRLRASLCFQSGLTHEDLDWLVIEVFLEAVRAFKLQTQGKLAAINLIRNTQKNIKSYIRHECSWVELKTVQNGFREENLLGSTPSVEHQIIHQKQSDLISAEQYRALLDELCKDEPDEDVTILFDTYLKQKPLITYVQERWADADEEEIVNRYQWCCQRRKRLVRRLRKKIGDNSFFTLIVQTNSTAMGDLR